MPMHPFFFVGALLHATAILVIAFFVWFAASRASGLLRLFGGILGLWLVVLAVLAVVFGASGAGKRWAHPGWGPHGPMGPPAAAAPSPAPNAAP
ncbi:MAG TPA: hypothetical protein VGS12_00990 [Caulobacteraceae bacterium]|nr:hypothetical protein [Caulobacteraceae bacterium]